MTPACPEVQPRFLLHIVGRQSATMLPGTRDTEGPSGCDPGGGGVCSIARCLDTKDARPRLEEVALSGTQGCPRFHFGGGISLRVLLAGHAGDREACEVLNGTEGGKKNKKTVCRATRPPTQILNHYC